MTETEEQPEVKAAEPAKNKPATDSKLDRFKDWYTSNRKVSIPATVGLLLIILLVIPFSRFAIAGAVYKKDFSVKVVDSTSGTPVSGATVSAGGLSAETSGTGVATLRHISVGSKNLTITKKYYKDGSTKLVVPILKQKTINRVTLTATGRQVKVTITDLINKQPLADAGISAAGTTAKTDKTGSAILVVPANVSQQLATLSLAGYNDRQVTLKVSGDKIQDNVVSLTPAGKVYFLSKLSGKIDVVKTNLDGTNRQTVLAGTGKEDDLNTVLLASRDWKYLALLSRRAGSLASLYLIDTSNDSLDTIDQGNANFTPVGWSDDTFVYKVDRNDVSNWKPGSQSVKSFNAPNQQIIPLYSNQAQGTSQYDYLQEDVGSYGIYLVDNNVIYTREWQAGNYYSTDIESKQGGIYSIGVNGKNPQTLKNFSYKQGASTYIGSVFHDPSHIYYQLFDRDKEQYLVYADGKISNANINNDQFTQYLNDQTTYLNSPSDKQTFWSDPRDGKNTLFIGDSEGQDGKQIATLSDYNTYGWYTDDYLLVSKNSSELYIMDKDGKQAPIKISDYHKPAQNFYGYGGGYGGL